jgi:hypothetical protein
MSDGSSPPFAAARLKSFCNMALSEFGRCQASDSPLQLAAGGPEECGEPRAEFVVAFSRTFDQGTGAHRDVIARAA